MVCPVLFLVLGALLSAFALHLWSRWHSRPRPVPLEAWARSFEDWFRSIREGGGGEVCPRR